MNSTTFMQSDRGSDVELPDYRAISKAVVFALVLSLAGTAGILAPLFLVLPVFAIVLGILGVRQIRRYPNELTGAKPGYFAIGFAVVVLVVGSSLHAYEYATEVPENAERVAFWELMASDRPGQPRIPPTALQLDGQRVFIKGYVHPSVEKAGSVDQFLLVGDLGTCCYGGQPKLTHMIDVRLSGDLKIKYSYRKRAVAGILRVDPTPKSADGLQGACYYMEADYLK